MPRAKGKQAKTGANANQAIRESKSEDYEDDGNNDSSMNMVQNLSLTSNHDDYTNVNVISL